MAAPPAETAKRLQQDVQACRVWGQILGQQSAYDYIFMPRSKTLPHSGLSWARLTFIQAAILSSSGTESPHKVVASL